MICCAAVPPAWPSALSAALGCEESAVASAAAVVADDESPAFIAEASSEAANATTFAISAGVAIRRNG